MAIREEGDDTVGRALINDSDPDNKIFVRSYRRNNDGYSHSDEQLEAWLKSCGYTKANDWEGLKLKAITYRNDWVAPYLDGNVKHATLKSTSDETYFMIDSDGDYEMDNTSGFTRERHEYTCEDCGDGYDEGDGYWVGIYEDRGVCERCCDNNYVYAYSRRGNQHYIPNDNTVYVNDDYYDTDYLDDNEIVCDVDGEYHNRDDVVYIDSESEYYPCDDDRIVCAEDTGEYDLKDNCWQCEESSNWYTNDCTDYVEIDGARYHADHAPEQTTKEETNE